MKLLYFKLILIFLLLNTTACIVVNPGGSPNMQDSGMIIPAPVRRDGYNTTPVPTYPGNYNMGGNFPPPTPPNNYGNPTITPQPAPNLPTRMQPGYSPTNPAMNSNNPTVLKNNPEAVHLKRQMRELFMQIVERQKLIKAYENQLAQKTGDSFDNKSARQLQRRVHLLHDSYQQQMQNIESLPNETSVLKNYLAQLQDLAAKQQQLIQFYQGQVNK